VLHPDPVLLPYAFALSLREMDMMGDEMMEGSNGGDMAMYL